MSVKKGGSKFAQICNTAILRSGATGNKSVTDMLVKLLVTLIEYKKYDVFTKDDLIGSFASFYNLPISKMMLGELIPELKKKRLIKEENKGIYKVNTSEIAKLNCLKTFQDFELQRGSLLEAFIRFSKDKDIKITKNDADRILSSYIEDRVCSLGGDNSSEEILTDTEKYVSALFISNEKENNTSFYEIYENILVGRMLASFILSGVKTTNESPAIFNKMTIFLDTGFIFNLLGLNEYSTSFEYRDLLSTLSSLGAKFKIFDHTFNEVHDIIYSSKQWVENPLYISSRASNVNEYFVSNKYTIEEIEEYLYTLETKLKEFGIVKYDANIDYNEEDTIYQERIKVLIIDEYKRNGGYVEEKEQTYELDAKSLFAIHKLRRGKSYRRFEDTEFFLLTTNRAIAKISNTINKERFGERTMPYAFTDSFISVLLFFTYPNYSSETNERFCIPAAYHAFEPSKELIKRIEKVLAAMQEKGLITAADSLSWRTSKVLTKYILEETKNNPQNFNEDTPDKIFELIQKDADERVEKAKKEANELVETISAETDSKIEKSVFDKNAALEQLEKTRAENERLISELNEHDQKEKEVLVQELGSLTSKIEKQSKCLSRIIFGLAIALAIVLIGGLLWLSDYLKKQDNFVLHVVCYIISAIPIIAPILVSPPLLGQKIETSISKRKNKKHCKQTSEINQRIKDLDTAIQKRNGNKGL